MGASQEFEREPVAVERLEPARHFAASYAGEHVAGTEFVIGALFVSWGVSTQDILWGLLLGNLLAVLTWAFICAPIAVQTRLTLYAYLEKIAGPGTIKLYSVVNGVLFCILAGTMITVSASAVRILFSVAPQLHWYPTSLGFVLIALLVGAVVVFVAIKGFRRVAQFAQVCAPWMVVMFIAGALAVLPNLFAATSGLDNLNFWDRFFVTADTHIWRQSDSGLNFWHVASFAWICNFAMHGGLSDMTLLRFARSANYGFFSAFGMFIGHYLAWVCAGIMGAGAALVLNSSVTQLDAGEVAFQALGAAGILAVIIAGWTTSNPTIYRAGLAFQSLNPSWNRVTVTAIVGVVTTVVACFPFVFSRLMEFVGLMGLVLAPVGAVIVTEHWVFPRLGLTRYWAHFAKKQINIPAVCAWVGALLVAVFVHSLGLHLFFLMIPTFLSAMAIYFLLAWFMGARCSFSDEVEREEVVYRQRLQDESNYFSSSQLNLALRASGGHKQKIYGFIAILSLLTCLGMAFGALFGFALESFRFWLIFPSLVYFVAAVLWAVEKESTF